MKHGGETPVDDVLPPGAADEAETYDGSTETDAQGDPGSDDVSPVNTSGDPSRSEDTHPLANARSSSSSSSADPGSNGYANGKFWKQINRMKPRPASTAKPPWWMPNFKGKKKNEAAFQRAYAKRVRRHAVDGGLMRDTGDRRTRPVRTIVQAFAKQRQAEALERQKETEHERAALDEEQGDDADDEGTAHGEEVAARPVPVVTDVGKEVPVPDPPPAPTRPCLVPTISPTSRKRKRYQGLAWASETYAEERQGGSKLRRTTRVLATLTTRTERTMRKENRQHGVAARRSGGLRRGSMLTTVVHQVDGTGGPLLTSDDTPKGRGKAGGTTQSRSQNSRGARRELDEHPVSTAWGV